MNQRERIAGMIVNNTSITVEHRMSDAELIGKLVGDDPVLVAAMRARIGADSTFH